MRERDDGPVGIRSRAVTRARDLRLGDAARAEAWLVRSACWFLVVLLIFSIIKPKRDLYLLPIYPAFALIAAREWSIALESGHLAKWVTHTTSGLILALGMAIGAVLPILNLQLGATLKTDAP